MGNDRLVCIKYDLMINLKATEKGQLEKWTNFRGSEI